MKILVESSSENSLPGYRWQNTVRRHGRYDIHRDAFIINKNNLMAQITITI